MWNIGGIIEKMSERQNRMEEKYFNQNIKRNIAALSQHVNGISENKGANEATHG